MEESKSFCSGTQTILLWGTQALLAGSAGKPNPGIKKRCDVEISTFCPGKEKQDMTRTMGVGGTCQALSSPTTSTGTLSAPAASINQLLAGRKGENLVRGEELQLYSSDLNNYRLRGTWTGTQSSNNNRRSYFWSDYNMISFLFYIRKQTTFSKYSCSC